MGTGGLLAIGREAGVERRCSGARGEAKRRARPKREAHHGYIPGASHVRRERRLWSNIGRCLPPVAHVLRKLQMLCPGSDQRVAPPFLGALVLIVLGAGRLSLIVAGLVALAAGWSKCHHVVGLCWPPGGKVTSVELLNALSFGTVAALIFLAVSISSREGQEHGHKFQIAKHNILSGAPLGDTVGRDDMMPSTSKAAHQVGVSLDGPASTVESSESFTHNYKAVQGVPVYEQHHVSDNSSSSLWGGPRQRFGRVLQVVCKLLRIQ